MISTINNNETNKHSILVIGATGRTGKEIMKELSKHPADPRVHAFCRNPDKLNEGNNSHRTYHSVIKGNARDPNDLSDTLTKTKANIVIVAVGNGDSVKKSDIRTVSAQALCLVLQENPEFDHVHVVVVSSTGAGGSKIKIGLGMGKFIEHHLRHVLHDHNGQEAAFEGIKDRTLIVRPTALTDEKPSSRIIEFGDKAKSPTIHTDRTDVARYLVATIYSQQNGLFGGESVNITGSRN